MEYYSTRDVARILEITPARLTKALWDRRVESPQKAPSGAFLWTARDIERASWALLHRSSGLVEKSEPQHIRELLPDLMDDIAQRGTGK